MCPLGRGKNAFLKRMDHYSASGFVFLVFSACVSSCIAFYLPGLAPVSYCEPGKVAREISNGSDCLVGAVSHSSSLFRYLAVSVDI